MDVQHIKPKSIQRIEYPEIEILAKFKEFFLSHDIIRCMLYREINSINTYLFTLINESYGGFSNSFQTYFDRFWILANMIQNVRLPTRFFVWDKGLKIV